MNIELTKDQLADVIDALGTVIDLRRSGLVRYVNDSSVLMQNARRNVMNLERALEVCVKAVAFPRPELGRRADEAHTGPVAKPWWSR
jgi:hypothetical protein